MVEALLLAASCSLDAFVASIAYGTNKVKIPFISIQIINLVCSSILAISLFFGSIVKKFLPGNISTIISFIALMLLGGRYIIQSIIKSYVEKNKNSDKSIKFKLYDLRFVLNIYVSESEEDSSSLKSVKSKEAFYLAVALSLDSLAVGFASALGSINYKQVVLFSLITDAVAVWAGLFLGRKFVEKTKLNLSWLSGLILIGLAFMKLI
ncbi:sporulation membrane protein YtaF [Clostridium amazonitimonense]|uniref:sporulation membrane protein YtaF n=1 Tax=Clostridium amazonitimonense TaxID=1499689 RepID=UPI000509F6F3|nr:sporulation membrane protein YtaF [Clostridium amazonitimonense]